MGLPLLHSPAAIVARILIEELAGREPDGSAVDWQVYVGIEPNRPDSVMTVFDTTSEYHGRTAPDNGADQHYGIQVRVRSRTAQTGFVQALVVCQTVDERSTQRRVVIGVASYMVATIVRRGDPINIGRGELSDLNIVTLNAVLAVRRLS